MRKLLQHLLLQAILVLATGTAYAQNVITGRVIDAQTGDPLIGASVIVKTDKQGVITDVDGKFSLSTKQEFPLTLHLDFVGYRGLDVDVYDNSEPIEIQLQENYRFTDEVVVIGYGQRKKENLAGSVSQVNGDELILRPVTDASQSLQGIVPGLLITNSQTSRPGATASLTLRGQGNLDNTANPYILVDGVEMSLSDIDPNDIENISVLKDASASAIYGARAAYGVILVTTKKGKSSKPTISYHGSISWSTPTKMPKMVNGYEFAKYFNAACVNSGFAKQYSDEKLDLLQQYIEDPSSVDPWFELSPSASLNPAFENTGSGVGNVDYFKLHYKDFAFKHNHNVSVSGGNDKTQYYLSGGFYDEDGILRFADLGYKRVTGNSNLQTQATKWLKLKLNVKYLYSVNDTPFGDGAYSEQFYHSLARFRPTVSEIDPNGNYTELSMVPYFSSGTYTKTISNQFTITPALEVEPIKNWKIFLDYTYRQNLESYKALNVAPLIYAADGVTTSKGIRADLGASADGKFTRSESTPHYQTLNLYTTYDLTLKKKHNFTLTIGYQQEDYTYSYLKNVVTGVFSTSNPSVSLSSGDQTIIDTRYSWATQGYFGRFNYDYDNRYIIEIDGRYDGSSRFASDHRWGFFPSTSVAWNISNEKFLKPLKHTLSTLKLRASYGKLGNQNGAAVYTFASTMSLSSALGGYIFADGRHSYTTAAPVIDPSTTWEKVTSKNVGVDFGLFDNKLTGSFDIFQRDTKDMLGPSADFADLFGASSPKTNNANMRNRGWELSLNYRGNIGNDITFQIGGLISDATSEVTAYENPTGTSPSSNWYVGKYVGEIWGYRADGLIQTQDEADAYNSTYDTSYLTGQAWTPGDIKYKDLNGDNKINNGSDVLGDTGDLTIIGNTTPRYQYSINGSINWKGITLSALFQGVGKRDFSPASGDVYFWGSGAYAQVTVFEEHLDYWTPDNPNAYYPKPYTGAVGVISNYRNKTSLPTDLYLQNAAYLRLKNVTLSYDLPKQLISSLGVNKVQVYFTGENLLTFSSIKDMLDPETVFVSSLGAGKNYPINKVFSFGLIVNL